MDLRAPFSRPIIVAGLLSGDGLAYLQSYAHSLASPTSNSDGRLDRGTKWWRTFADIAAQEGPKARLSLIETLVGAKLFGFARASLGDDIAIITEYCQFRRYDPRPGLLPSHWHYDTFLISRNARMLTFWIALEDVDEATPGLTIATSSCRPTPIWNKVLAGYGDPDRIYPREKRDTAVLQDEDVARAVALDPELEFISPRLPAGGAIVFDGRFLHRTEMLSPAHSKPRFSLEVRALAWNDLPADIFGSNYEVARTVFDPDQGTSDISIVTTR
jgi:hypothetical protein